MKDRVPDFQCWMERMGRCKKLAPAVLVIFLKINMLLRTHDRFSGLISSPVRTLAVKNYISYASDDF